MPIPTSTQRLIAAAILLAALSAVVGSWISDALADPPAATPDATQPAAEAAVPAPATPAPPATGDPNKVQIIFSTVPPTKATVTWGRTKLGRTGAGGLVVVRPRDSGPLDVVVRAPGFLPVQTRANTFADNRVQVKLTRLDEKNTLLGYKEPIDAGVPDGGIPEVPENLSGMPPSLGGPTIPPQAAPPLMTPAPVTPAPVTPAPVTPAPVVKPAPVAPPPAH
jgi:hypothetical protein